MTASRYNTPAACPVCEGTLAMDDTSAVYCTSHGTTDVPTIAEIRANVTDGFTVERHPGNQLLYVVPSNWPLHPSLLDDIHEAALAHGRGRTNGRVTV